MWFCRLRDKYKYIPVILVITLVLYYPVVIGLSDAFFNDKGYFTLSNIQYVLSRKSIQYAIKFTFIQALLSSTLSVILGFMAAVSLLILGFRGANIYRSLTIIPFMAPPMVVVMGFTTLYGSHGLLTSIHPWFKVFGEGFWAVIAAHVFYNIPLALNMAYAALVSIPKDLIDSMTLFSRGRMIFILRRIITPYILPAIFSSFMLIFIYCFTSFAIPLSLGGVKYSTLEVYIYYYYKIYFDEHKAAAIAFIQYIFLLAFVALFVVLHGRTFTAPIGYRHYRLGFGRKTRILLAIYLAAITFYLYAPLVSIVYYSFYNPVTKAIRFEGFTRLFTTRYDPALGIPTHYIYINTLYYAFIVALLSMTLSTIVVIHGSRVTDVLYASILAISPLTIALGLVRAYGRVLENYMLIIIAHTIASLPLTTRVLRLGFSRIPREVVDAARVLGARGLTMYLRILLPLAKPSYLVALSLALVVSLGEFSSTFFIHIPETTTLGVAIYKYRALRLWTASSSAALILLLLTGSILVLLSRKMERWL